MTRVLVAVFLVSVACSSKRERASPAPIANAEPVTKAAPTPAKPVAAPLDPTRADAEKANRDALAVMKKALPCPQSPPSTFVRYCRAAEDFASGNVAELVKATRRSWVR
jgi:hypothetical protein